MAASRQNPLPFDPNTQGPIPGVLITNVELSNYRVGHITKRLWSIKYAFQDGAWVNFSSVACRWFYHLGDELIPNQGALLEWIAMPEFFPKPRGLTQQELDVVFRRVDEKPVGFAEDNDGILRPVFATMQPTPAPVPAPQLAAAAPMSRSDSGYGSMNNTPTITPNTRSTAPTVSPSASDLTALQNKNPAQLVEMSSPLTKEEQEFYWAHCQNI